MKLPPPKTVEARNYKSYNSELFKSDLKNIPWDILELESSPDEAWNSFRDLFMTVADTHAPVETRRVRGRSLPWITPCIKELMKQRDYHHKKAISTNKELHWSSYKRIRNAITMKLRKEKSSYYTTQLSEEQNSKEMWKTLNEILPKKKKKENTGASNCDGLTATKFNEFFTTIAKKLCGNFISNSTMPKILTPRVPKDFVLQNVSFLF